MEDGGRDPLVGKWKICTRTKCRKVVWEHPPKAQAPIIDAEEKRKRIHDEIVSIQRGHGLVGRFS